MIFERILIVALMITCGSAALAVEPVTAPTTRLLGSRFRAYDALDSLATTRADTISEPSGIVTLAQAQGYALMHSPRLQSFAWELRVAEARRLQAGVRPNPEIGLDVENGPGTGEMRGFDNAEQTLQVSQLFELASKRQKRLAISSRERDLAKWDYEAARLDVLTEVTQRFYEILAAQERAVLAEENDQLAEDVLATATKRVQTGIASADEEMKARLAVSLAHIEKDRVERILTSSKIKLVSTWGSKQSSFASVQDGFDSLAEVPAYDELASRLTDNPDVARWNTELAKREGILNLEKASRTPDITLAAGVRRFSAGGDVAMVMGASIPIPIFNINQGNISAAHHGLTKGHTEQSMAVSQATSSLSDAYRGLSAAYNEATKLKNEVLPEAKRVFDVAGEKYRQGKSSYLEVLDAQRTVVEVRGRYVDALESYHTARAAVERLIGMSLNDVSAAQDHK
jgi:cobalt-zinc-cadmium efflux system outer membrane protein